MTIGARVRVKKNDADVATGSMGTVVLINEDSGHPVVKIDAGRVVALMPHQLEVITLPPEKSPNGKYHWALWDPRPCYVSFSAHKIRMSQYAAEWFEGVNRVELLSDRAKGAVAIRPREGTTGKCLSLNRNKVGAEICATDFLSLIDLEHLGRNTAARRPARYDRDTDLLIVTGIPFRPEER